ncbi:MAG: hypothetical protein ACREFT_12415, partial [Acetobacteraceae bacterium]
TLIRRRGLRFRGSLPFYATREDLFRPGILARLTVHWPRFVSPLLRRISLAWFFPLGRTEPMRRVPEFTLGDALRALVEAGSGESDAGSVLNPRGQREAGIRPGALSVAALLERSGDTLEAGWGLRRLRREARVTITPGFRATIERQLTHFARRLDRGCSVYFSPEGTISTGGPFGRIRAGFFRVARKAESPPWIQPIALGYDTLAPGRSRVVIRIGQPFRADTALCRRDFDAELRRAVVALATITPSHLLARFLLHGPPTFSAGDLAHWLQATHAGLAAHGTPIDPLFDRVTADYLTARRLRWLRRKGLVVRDGKLLRNACRRDVPPGWRRPANVARYLDNALSDLVPGIERLSPC